MSAYANSSSWSISSSVRKSAFIESQAIGLFTDLGIAFENCICLEISVINNDIVKKNGGFSRGLTEVAYFISSLPDVTRTEESRRKGKTPKVKEWVSGSWACSEKLYDCHR